MSAKRYPPLLDWFELGAIAAAPLEDVCVGALVVGVCEVGVVAVVLVCELVVLPVVGVVVPADVVALVDVAVLDEADVLVELVVAGGGGAPAVGGSVEAFGPVTSAPFFAGIRTNAEESGVWMFASAPARLAPCPAARYPTAPAGGRTRPMPPASRSIR
jgi:hypothetical protein